MKTCSCSYIDPEKAEAALVYSVTGYYNDDGSGQNGEDRTSCSMRSVLDHAGNAAFLPIAHHLKGNDKELHSIYFNRRFYEQSTELRSIQGNDVHNLQDVYIDALVNRMANGRTPVKKKELQDIMSLIYHLQSPTDQHSLVLRQAIEKASELLDLGKLHSEEETLKLIPEMVTAANQFLTKEKNAKAI